MFLLENCGSVPSSICIFDYQGCALRDTLLLPIPSRLIVIYQVPTTYNGEQGRSETCTSHLARWPPCIWI